MRNISLIIVSMLVIAACSAPQVSPDKFDRQLFSLGTYSVKAPSPKSWLVEVPPAKWEVKTEEVNGHKSITFIKVFKTAFGEFKHSDMISIIPNVTGQEAWEYPIGKFADKVVDHELKIMNIEGVDKGIYVLDDVNKSDMKMAGIDLYCLSYVKWIGGKRGAGTESGRLALYFPEKYETDHVFYMFLISNMNTGSGGHFYVDEDAFKEVVESFQLSQQ